MEVTIDNLDDMCSLMCDNVVPQKGERTMRYEDYKVEDMVFTNKEDWTEEEKREFLDTCPEGKGIEEKVEILNCLLEAIESGELKMSGWNEIKLNSAAAYAKRHNNCISISRMSYSDTKAVCIQVDGENEYLKDQWDITRLIKNLSDIEKRFEKIKRKYLERETIYKKKHEKEIYEETNKERIIASRIAYAWLDSIRVEIPTGVKERRYWSGECDIPEFETESKSFRGYDLTRRNNYNELEFYGKPVTKEDAEYISKIVERATWDLLPVINKCFAAIEDVREKYKED